jgi:DNA modification methylase
MHRQLDRVWDEVNRVLINGGIACINIGDATRTINEKFALYPNHTRIQTHMQKIGFSALPVILWRKQTNAPNKFMGSGMMPPGAYVTLEHEYILILRKGNKKEFKTAEKKKNRRESAFFWEERNTWFSDVWMDLKGTVQTLFDDKVRNRSGAFPFELPYRLIAMFSVKGDTVLDPFLGMGTTMFAAAASCRNSIGYEIDPHFRKIIYEKVDGLVDFSNIRIDSRLENHVAFVEHRHKQKGKFKHLNRHYRFPVMTGQEKELLINRLTGVEKTGKDSFEVCYSEDPQEEFTGEWNDYLLAKPDRIAPKEPLTRKKSRKARQTQLFD